MNNSENIKETQKLLWEVYEKMLDLQMKLLNVQTEDEENIEVKKEILRDIIEIYKILRDDFEASLWGEV